jgi:hypothetical protein
MAFKIILRKKYEHYEYTSKISLLSLIMYYIPPGPPFSSIGRDGHAFFYMLRTLYFVLLYNFKIFASQYNTTFQEFLNILPRILIYRERKKMSSPPAAGACLSLRAARVQRPCARAVASVERAQRTGACYARRLVGGGGGMWRPLDVPCALIVASASRADQSGEGALVARGPRAPGTPQARMRI